MSPWNSLPQSKANKLEQFQSHLQTLWEEPQSRCPILIAFSRSQSNHSRTHTPSSLNYQFHSVVPGQPNNWGPSNQTCFAGRSWGKILHNIHLVNNPHGLMAFLSRFYTPRQTTDPLAPPSAVLVAWNDQGCCSVCERLRYPIIWLQEKWFYSHFPGDHGHTSNWFYNRSAPIW